MNHWGFHCVNWMSLSFNIFAKLPTARTSQLLQCIQSELPSCFGAYSQSLPIASVHAVRGSQLLWCIQLESHSCFSAYSQSLPVALVHTVRASQLLWCVQSEPHSCFSVYSQSLTVASEHIVRASQLLPWAIGINHYNHILAQLLEKPCYAAAWF